MANLHVLLADSDAAFRSQAQTALTRQGYFVIPAADGREAMARLENGQLDVVVAEVSLPVPDGLELVQAAQNRTPRLPVILLADALTIGSAAQGVHAGAFDYLVKPIDDMTRLAIMIDRAAGQAGAPSTPPAAALPSAQHPPAPQTATEDLPPRLLDAVSKGENLNTVLELFAAELARLARAAHALVLLAHSDGQLHLSADHGYTSRAEAGRSYTNAIGEPFAWRTATAKALTWETSPRDSSMPYGILGVPLMFGGQVLGVAIAHQTAPRGTFSPAALAQIEDLARQGGIAIEMARLAARVRRLEPRDSVTGLLSREYFLELADRDFRRAWRFNHALSVIVMDIDDFGRMHLTLGPEETDRVMRRVAHVVQTHVRSVDLVGRLDTDTFGLVLLMAKKEHGILVAERLRRLVAEVEVQTMDDTWQVTASLGSASYPRDNCASIFDLLGVAEQALRVAKRAGRNRVEGV